MSDSFATTRTIAYQASLSLEFTRQKFWSGLPFSFPGDLPHPGIKPRSFALQADTLLFEPPGTITLTNYTFVNKVISLLFNMLSRFAIVFLPKTRYLLILWLQSLSAEIL